MILSLKKSLEAEQLKSMTLAQVRQVWEVIILTCPPPFLNQELEMKKSSILDSQQPPGFFSSR